MLFLNGAWQNLGPVDKLNKFKGDNGDFQKCMIDDVRGMLSFYESISSWDEYRRNPR